MGSTTLFVEILITGLEAIVWVGLSSCALLGPQWVAKALDFFDKSEVFSTTVLLGFAYVIGIIVEEVTDALFEPWSDRLKATYSKVDIETYYHMQTYVSGHEKKEDDQFSYKMQVMERTRSLVMKSIATR